MKKTYKQIKEGLEQVTVELGPGHELKFLNGVLQVDKEKFIVGRSPLNGGVMLIISDYAYWHINETAIEEYISRFDGAIRRDGMILTFDNEQDRLAFLLAWN